MTFLDTSVIIDYLDDVDAVVSFVDEQESLLTSSICVYEVLEGEVFGPGRTDVYQARQDFGRVQSLDFNQTIAMEAARIQDKLLKDGDPLAPRDMMIAATARSTGDRLVISDTDFEVDILKKYVDVVHLDN